MKYPKLEELLTQELAAWSHRNGCPRPSIRKLASLISTASDKKITFSAVDDWLKGRAKPQQESMVALTTFLRPDDPVAQDTLSQQIAEATRAPGIIPSPLNDLIDGRRALRVGVIDYGPICSAKDTDAFLNSFLWHFASYSHLSTYGTPRFMSVALAQVEEELCEKGTYDLVIGIFAEPRRASRLWFYRDLPLRIPLNAIGFRSCFSRVGGIDSVRRALRRDVNARSPVVLPIIDPTELGGIYVRNYLAMPERATEQCTFNIDEMAELLVQRSAAKNEERSPVVLADEISIAYIGKEANRLAERKHSTLGNVELVFPAGESGLPRYRVGIAAARTQADWISYLTHSLDLFVETNEPLLGNQCDTLKEALLSDLTKTLGGADNCRNFIDTWLSPREFLTPWAQAVKKAMPLPGSIQKSLDSIQEFLSALAPDAREKAGRAPEPVGRKRSR